MNQIEALEAAKRRAASSYTRMVAHPLPQATAQVTRDEQDVLCARVDVLNALLRQQSETPLCLEATGRKGPRVCVTYDRLRCEGELELGPMQSTMAWAVRDAEDAVLQLMSSQDSHPPAAAVKALLDLVRQSAPKKDILQGLHAALSMPGPERLVLKSLQGVNALETDGHTRVYEGLGEADGPTPPLYRVLWGALSLDVLEGWQNPSTNAAIRLSILHAAHQAAREAQQTKAPQWSNVAYLQVRVYHGDECHRLSLRPFWDSESCTVSHIQFRQSVFDDSGPERGLLNLGSDPNSIHPIPMGKILPLEAYVCLGAHRKSRLSEAQLNYVHAQGLLAHGFDTKLLPDSARLLQVQPGRMPPAKATRVSGDKLDVMASSYHLADQVYTTISVVQYPPFGTQFERQARQEQVLSKTAARLKNLGPHFTFPNPLPPERPSPERREAQQTNPDEDFEVEIEEEPDAREQHPPLPSKTRLPLREGETPLYKLTRQYLPKFDDDGTPRARKNNWKIDLRAGEHYFIDGLHADPNSIKPKAFKQRFVWFELDQGTRYKAAEKLFAETKQLIRDQQIPWMSDECFYSNLEFNKNTGINGLTAGEIWYNQWKPFILFHATMSLKAADEDREYKHFWFCMDDPKWDDIFKEQSERDRVDYAFHYKKHQQTALLSARRNRLIDKQLLAKIDHALHIDSGQIPLPQTRLSARSDPAVSQLQSRIAALESKLGQAKQDENTQFLLAKVLDKLDAIEEV
jgi:hypothetical protein